MSVTSIPRARYAHKIEKWMELDAYTLQVTGYDGTPSELAECLRGSEIVVIPAGVPRKPGMTRDGMSKYKQEDCKPR